MKINNFIKLLITLILYFIIFYFFIDINTFFSLFYQIKIVWFIFGFLLLFLGIYISSLKWKLILKNIYNIDYNLKKLFFLYMIGGFYNLFLPSTIGGDGYKFYILNKKYENKKKEIFSSLLLERGTGYLTNYLVHFLILILFLNYLINDKIIIYIELIIFSSFLLILFFIFYGKKIFSKFSIFNKYKLYLKFIDLIKILHNSIKYKKIIFVSFFISFLFTILVSFAILTYFWALGLEINYYIVLFVTTIITIVSFIPISINNLGVNESLSVFLYGVFGISPEIALSVAILGRIAQTIGNLIGGLFLFVEK